MFNKISELMDQIKNLKKFKEENISLKKELSDIKKEKEKLDDEFINLENKVNSLKDELINKETMDSQIEKRYSILFKHAPNPYLIVNSDLEIIDYNRESYQKFNIKEEGFTVFSSLIEKESFFDLIQSRFMEKDSSFTRLLVRMKERDNKSSRYNLSVVKDPSNTNNYLFSLIDTEEEIRYKEKLENQIEEQIEEIKNQHEIVIQNTKMASLGEMMTMIAHQWRQPINAISVWSNAIEMYIEQEYKYDNKLKPMINNISDQIDYMDETIENFRSFYKKDKETRNFSLSVAINHTISIVKGSLESNHINLILELDDSLLINGIEGEIQQVLMVLINNAIDAMKDSKIKDLKISTFRLSNNIFISTHDSGYGIENSIKDKIFQPYFSTKSLNGTGLGLYMCKSILEQSFNGRITFNSDNEGTEFLIVI